MARKIFLHIIFRNIFVQYISRYSYRNCCSNYCHYNRGDLAIASLAMARTISFRIGRISAFSAMWDSRNDEKPRDEMPSATTKARGISEIYTGHKRREGVVKVFRCKFLIVRVRMSDEFLNSPPSYIRGWHSSSCTCARFDVAAPLSPHILPIVFSARAIGITTRTVTAP